MDNNVFGQTDIGRVRSNNEDAFLADELLHSDLILGCVIDGVGGYEGGEIAAEITKDCIKRNLYGLTDEDLIPRMAATLKLANEEIYNRKQQDTSLTQMACVLTLVLADVKQNKFYYAHVGDTRLYLLRDQELVKITTDHSFVGFLEDSGRLTESAAMSHPKRNEINQALGFNSTESMKPDFIETGESPFLPGDTLLLCSDGLTDKIDKDQIKSILIQHTSLHTAAGILIDAANEAGGHDNITVVLLRNNTKPANFTIPKPVQKVQVFEEEMPKRSAQSLPAISQPAAPKRSRGWMVFLLTIIFLLSGLVAWMYLQIIALQKPSAKVSPVYENPWEPLLPNPQDTIKIPLRDTVYYKNTDTIATKSELNGKRTTE